MGYPQRRGENVGVWVNSFKGPSEGVKTRGILVRYRCYHVPTTDEKGL